MLARLLNGRVTGPGDQPIANALVAIVDSSYRATALATTGADGTFRLAAPEAPYQVSVTADGYTAARLVTAPAVATYDFHLAPTSGNALVFDVVSQHGKPVEDGTKVRASRWQWARVDVYYFEVRAGSVRAWLPPGVFDLMVDDDDWTGDLGSSRGGGPGKLIARHRRDTEARPSADVITALREACTTVSPDSTRSLSTRLASSSIVGLGESTHGTHEFSQIRTQIVKELVSRHGFDTIALEAPWRVTTRLNAALNEDTGDIRGALSEQPYWPWRTQELHELLAWLRTENLARARDRRVLVVGVDVDSPRDSAASLRDIAVDAPRAAQKALRLAAVALDAHDTWASLRGTDGKAKDSLIAALGEARAALLSDRLRRPDALAAVVLDSVERLVESAKTRGWPDRDRHMAEVLLSLRARSQPERRIAFWAHDGHVAKGAFQSSPPTGAYLVASLGTGFASVGTLALRGTFRAYSIEHGRMVVHAVEPPPDYFIEAAFGRASVNASCLLDMRDVRDAALAAWLASPHPRRYYGADVLGDRFPWPPVALSATWDAMLFVPVSTPTMDLETPGEAGRGAGPKTP